MDESLLISCLVISDSIEYSVFVNTDGVEELPSTNVKLNAELFPAFEVRKSNCLASEIPTFLNTSPVCRVYTVVVDSYPIVYSFLMMKNGQLLCH